MNFRKLALFAVAVLATAGVSAIAADMTFSTGATFITGPRTIDGSDLNVMVSRVNGLSNGSFPVTGNALIGAGVNQVSLAGGATTVGPVITVGGTGSDTNIGILMAGKGTGAAHLGGTTLSNASLRVPTIASSVNQVQISGAVTGSPGLVTIGGTASDTNADLNLSGKGVGLATLGPAAITCSGTTTATCTGQSFIVSITGLTTAAGGTESAAMTVTNTFVSAATRRVVCSVNIYAGTGNPIATRVTPGVGTVSLTITNVAASGSLNATVPVACLAF